MHHNFFEQLLVTSDGGMLNKFIRHVIFLSICYELLSRVEGLGQDYNSTQISLPE